MTPERYKRVEEVFGLAIEREGEERTRLLTDTCGDDAELRREVEALLAEHERAGDFLDAPVLPVTIPASPQALNGGAVVDGKYRIEALLGRGGMGEVYRATQLSLQRTVALKVIRGELADTPLMLAQFRREAHAIARLHHPNIVTIHEYGIDPGVGAFLVMEFLEGRSLRDELEERGRLPAEEIVGYIRQVCAAVGAAHEAGIIHRDLKPDNIFLETEKSGPRLKVLDFGIAKMAAGFGQPPSAWTTGGVVLGTPAYMAPEQAAGDSIDIRTDIYALGCVLYELATGRPPFTGSTSAQVLKQHLTDRPRPPRDVTPEVPKWLDSAILRALSKIPRDRFQTIDDLLRVLDADDTLEIDGPITEAGNLPTFVGAFVGRGAEIAAVGSLLSAGRLVTLTGPGGTGKTRLSVEAAASLRERFADGVWLVELASLSDPRLVAASVASVLGLREEGAESIATTVTRALRGRELLIVLDNCEHLVEASARFAADLLHSCPGVRILATSREALGVEGEARYDVPPLGLPDATEAVPVEAVAACEAVQLFVERTRSVKPAFSLTERNAGAVAEICRQLDGIPLAIELAAARARALSVEQILDRLRDRFRLLAGVDKTVLPRHQTLRAAVDWSYTLLTEDERALLNRLSVFVGGWELEAAEAVAADLSSASDVAAADVLDTLTRLVDKSLVTVDDRDRGARYGMLETIRQYAWDRLSESGDAAAARAAHTTWFVALAERARCHWQGPDEGVWITRLAADHDSLRAVLEREAEDRRDPRLRARFCTALSHYWIRTGNIGEGRRWFVAVLADEDALTTAERAAARASAGQLAAYDGDLNAARDLLEKSIHLFRSLGDKDGLSRGLGSLAIVLVTAGIADLSAGHAAESLSLARELGDWQRISSALNVSATQAIFVGRTEAAEPLLRERLDICRKHQSTADLVVTLLQLSGCLVRLERLGEGEALLDECEAVARRDGFAIFLLYACGQRGMYALRRGEAARAVDRFEEALAGFWELKYRDGTSAALDDLACALAASGDHEEAMRMAGTATALRESMGTAITPATAADLELYLGPSRRALGERAESALFAEGRAMSVDTAVTRHRPRRSGRRS